jgi:tRNA G10  N-methylase Trm11
MGVEAARYACRFLAKYGYVYNPFCGRGTVLAAANEIGLDAVGIDNDQRQCDYSEHATLPE